VNTPADAAEPRSGFRLRRLQLAVGTSLISKTMGLAVQLLAVPIAVNALGAERFGIYTMLVSLLTWIDLGSFGIGPGLTRGMAVAWNAGDQSGEKRYFSSGIVILAAICLVLALVFVVAVAYFYDSDTSLQHFFGPNGDTYRGEIRSAMIIIASFFLSQLLFSIGERARSAYQEDYINNAAYMIANLVSLVTMLVIAHYWQTIEGFALAVFAALSIAKGLNTALLICISRPYLFPRRADVDGATIRKLMSNGIPFWVIQASVLGIQTLSLFLLGWIAGPKVLAPFAILFRLLQLLATGVTMLTQPLWPSITDASVRGDHDWIRRSYLRATAYVVVYSLAVFLVFSLMGQTLLHFWLRGSVEVNRSLIVVMATYFIIWMWNNLHTSVFFGLGWLWQTATCLALEGLVGVALGCILARSHGALGMAVGLLIGAVTVTAWVQPLILRRGQFGQKRAGQTMMV
jgi:O-antigen/teichoic acid export membrane protein